MNRSAAVEAFYVSWQWRKCRESFIKAKGGLCERCLKKGIIEAGSKKQPLEVHHKEPLTDENINNPEITTNWENMELLCKKCHDEERGRKQKRWTVNEAGEVTV